MRTISCTDVISPFSLIVSSKLMTISRPAAESAECSVPSHVA
jgi:hypothetical protein